MRFMEYGEDCENVNAWILQNVFEIFSVHLALVHIENPAWYIVGLRKCHQKE